MITLIVSWLCAASAATRTHRSDKRKNHTRIFFILIQFVCEEIMGNSSGWVAHYFSDGAIISVTEILVKVLLRLDPHPFAQFWCYNVSIGKGKSFWAQLSALIFLCCSTQEGRQLFRVFGRVGAHKNSSGVEFHEICRFHSISALSCQTG